MSKTLPFTKLTVFFVLCSIYLFSFAHLGAFAFDRFISPDEAFLKGTRIGNVDVSTLPYQEAEDKLNVEIEDWKGNQSISLSYMGTQIPVDSKLFDFDLTRSIHEATQGESSPLLVDLQGLGSFLDSNEVNTSMVDMEALDQAIALYAANLVSTEETLPISDFFVQSDSIEIISEISMEGITLTPGLQNLIDTYPEIEIGGTTRFSLLKFLESEAFTGVSNQELSTLASGLYQLVLQTNFEVIERHQGRELPDTIDLGFEAYVNQDQGDDIVFTNPNDDSYTISIERQGEGLFLTLTGIEMPYEITVERRNEETFKPRVIKQYSPYLNSGEVKVTEEGRNGMKIEVWRSFETMNGELLKEERVSEDFYLPVYKEEIHSMKDYVVQESQPTSDTNGDGNTSLNESQTTEGSSEQTNHNGPRDPVETEEDSPTDSTNGDPPPSETDLPLSNMK